MDKYNMSGKAPNMLLAKSTPKPLRACLALLLIGAFMAVALLSCFSSASENTFGSAIQSPTLALASSQTPSFYVYTPTVTPPVLEFPGLRPGETPAVVKGLIHTLGQRLAVRAGAGPDFPRLGVLTDQTAVDVIGKNRGGWLYISYPSSEPELRGWVVGKYVLIAEDDVNKIGFVQIVTATPPAVLP